jgi:NUMOD3 motif
MCASRNIPRKLLFGPYRTPRFRYGSIVFCEVRGEVIITGLTDAPIPWPLGKKGRGGRARAPIVYRGLEEAVRLESASAVAFWWGVTAQTVTVWRKALRVPRKNEGSEQLWRENFNQPWGKRARARAIAKIRDHEKDAERREKIAAALRGRRLPRHVVEAMKAGRLGKPHSEEVRRKMSEAHRRRGTRPPAMRGPPWTAQEDALIGVVSDREVVARTGRTLNAVRCGRCLKGMAGPMGRPRVVSGTRQQR